MARLLLHPFALTPSGRVATAEPGSDAYLESQIRVIVGTKIGERDMCMPFGIPDPAFSRLTVADIQTCCDRFGPDELRITSVDSVATDEFNQATTINWDRQATL